MEALDHPPPIAPMGATFDPPIAVNGRPLGLSIQLDAAIWPIRAGDLDCGQARSTTCAAGSSHRAENGLLSDDPRANLQATDVHP